MINRFLIFFFFLIQTTFLSAFCFSLKDRSLDLSIGYRKDCFNWKVIESAIDLNSTEIAHLKSKNLNSTQFKIQSKLLTVNQVYGRFYADYGRFIQGYLKGFNQINDEVLNHSSSGSHHVKGQFYDLSGALGYQFIWFESCLAVSPLLGYSYHSQHIPMFNQTYLNSIYSFVDARQSLFKARWYGPWLGLDIGYQIKNCLSVFATFERHWSLYRATGCWSSMSDFFYHFSQHANARGYVGSLGCRYDWNSSCFFKILGCYQIWRTRIGTFVNPITGLNTELTKEYHPLRRVNWRSFTIEVSAGYHF